MLRQHKVEAVNSEMAIVLQDCASIDTKNLHKLNSFSWYFQGKYIPLLAVHFVYNTLEGWPMTIPLCCPLFLQTKAWDAHFRQSFLTSYRLLSLSALYT